MKEVRFEWDEEKDNENQAKHNVSFSLAQHAFLDPNRVIVEDVRFTYRGNVIRIYGAGYWRKGRKIYEDQNKIH